MFSPSPASQHATLGMMWVRYYCTKIIIILDLPWHYLGHSLVVDVVVNTDCSSSRILKHLVYWFEHSEVSTNMRSNNNIYNYCKFAKVCIRILITNLQNLKMTNSECKHTKHGTRHVLTSLQKSAYPKILL